MNLKNQLDIFDEIVSNLAHRVRLSLNYKKVFQFFNRPKLDKLITQTIGPKGVRAAMSELLCGTF